MKDRLREKTWDYHNDLLTMMDMKRTGDGEGGKKLNEYFTKVIEDFGSIVSIQQSMIEKSMELAKYQLERAFDLSGLDMKKLSDGLKEDEETFPKLDRIFSDSRIVLLLFKIFIDTSNKLFLFIIFLSSGFKYFIGSASTGEVAVFP